MISISNLNYVTDLTDEQAQNVDGGASGKLPKPIAEALENPGVDIPGIGPGSPAGIPPGLDLNRERKGKAKGLVEVSIPS